MMSHIFYYIQSYFLLHVKHVDYTHSNIYNVICIINYYLVALIHKVIQNQEGKSGSFSDYGRTP